uniref:Uncharacterized protein n=1 Tax=Equus caballus TaxID=9796 RepID=A0A3Q2HG85_HORSE
MKIKINIHQVYFYLLISGGLASSSPISGIPDSFSSFLRSLFLSSDIFSFILFLTDL